MHCGKELVYTAHEGPSLANQIRAFDRILKGAIPYFTPVLIIGPWG